MSKENNKPCPECGSEDNGFSVDDLFEIGSLLDSHLDTDISEEELGKRLAEAYEMSKKLGGTIPGGYEDDLDTLISPKLTWQDFIRFRKQSKKQGNGRNNWNTPKRKPLAAGLYIPQKINYYVKFLLAVDSSGSMSNQQITKIISEVQALDDHGDGVLCFWDTEVNWDTKLKLKSAKGSELSKAKIVGRGGTLISPVFDYEKELGKVDIVIIGTDGYVADLSELQKIKNPAGTDVIWLITGNSGFIPPFGRVFHLEV